MMMDTVCLPTYPKSTVITAEATVGHDDSALAWDLKESRTKDWPDKLQTMHVCIGANVKI